MHIAALRPTSLALPPRIWNGIRYLWDTAKQRAPPPHCHPALSLFRGAESLSAALGGRAAIIATGGAAPNPEVMAWVRAQFQGALEGHRGHVG